MKNKIWILGLLLLTVANFTFAQESKEDLSQQAANPLADLMSFPFQNNLNMNYGEFNRNMNVLNIQPVLPFAEGRIITRTIFSSPGASRRGTYKDAPGAPSSTGGTLFTSPFSTASQTMVRGSNQPPRNQQ